MKRGVWAGLLLAAGYMALVVLERRRPLRRRTEPAELVRAARNLSLGATGVLASGLVEWLVGRRAAGWAERRQVGVLRCVPVRGPLGALAGFLVLDYTLWIWHRLNHQWPALWRFHLVHHIDRDLDVSTGLRFHFGELALTIGLRALQVVVLGVDRRTLSAWQALLTLSVLFHHSNLRLPIGAERVLARAIATPRMHGIHHSEVRAETDSNYASLLTIWDVLHGTQRLHVPQDAITIGVPGHRDASALRFGDLLALPFGPQRESWTGAPPRRPPLDLPPSSTLAE